jgi:hypothetical protein
MITSTPDCFPEILHRFCHFRQTFGALHAERNGQLQVQNLEGGRLHSLRVLHHDPHCPQYHPTHDESKLRNFTASLKTNYFSAISLHY